ncbi:MAG: tRNA uridine-5-carboxymethylaminomethyl(34) synthesis GTPase MnmE [Alphaproteobacteria bacterium]
MSDDYARQCGAACDTREVIMVDATTIFALSTPPGRGGIAVIRVSGPAAGAALVQLCGSTGEARTARVTPICDPQNGALLDQAMTLWFEGPASFTGEDVAEFHCHGGRAVVEGVLMALGRMSGLRAANPGDFSRRAFENGKLDLTEVEGLADLIDAETQSQRAQAVAQLAGHLGALYDGWRTELIGILAHAEAAIDFAEEEDVSGLEFTTTRARVNELAGEMRRHLADGRRGRRLRDGLAVVIAGPPNAGKSSLLNALAQRDVAIVAAQAGTTRDAIEVPLDLGGFPVVVTDTAGLRASSDSVEREGVRRANSHIAAADLVIWLRDASDPEPPSPPDISAPIIDVWSKTDLAPAPPQSLGISVKTTDGIDALVRETTSQVAQLLTAQPGASPVMTRTRHRLGIEIAEKALSEIVADSEPASELVAENLRVAARALGRLTGRIDVEDLLDVVFADFCIGK